MSKNCVFGFAFAVIFLFAANVKADIENTWCAPQGEELFSFTLDVSYGKIGDETWFSFLPKKEGWNPSVSDARPEGLIDVSANSGVFDYGATADVSRVPIESISGFSISWDGAWNGFGAVTDLFADMTINGDPFGNSWWKTMVDNIFNGSTSYFTAEYSDLISADGTMELGFTSNVLQNLAGKAGNGYQITFTAYGEKPSATPEPATIALIGLGLAGLGVARARRRK
jgi:hypothetical protein